ncbi:hypothetical protein ACM0P6_09920 [Komagataeibacter sucrofermentans]|uniref:hypothetical protein n=1 Tax=Komagataeibacter sucrofermentans TaxID=1053551 RepID=UPI001FC9358B|nr:hypothetical protein [Komagataeibacter sucrofermentans]
MASEGLWIAPLIVRTGSGKVIEKARFWKNLAGQSINGRQRLMLERLFDGFKGKLTSSK